MPVWEGGGGKYVSSAWSLAPSPENEPGGLILFCFLKVMYQQPFMDLTCATEGGFSILLGVEEDLGMGYGVEEDGLTAALARGLQQDSELQWLQQLALNVGKPKLRSQLSNEAYWNGHGEIIPCQTSLPSRVVMEIEDSLEFCARKGVSHVHAFLSEK